jgi:hypothetical protein
MRSSCRHFSQLVIKWGRAQPIVSGAIPGLVVLDSIGQQAEQAKGNKPISSTPPWPLHQLLPPSSCPLWAPVLTSLGDEQQCESVSWINPFLPPPQKKRNSFLSWQTSKECFNSKNDIHVFHNLLVMTPKISSESTDIKIITHYSSEISYEVATKMILWVGATTTWGTIY